MGIKTFIIALLICSCTRSPIPVEGRITDAQVETFYQYGPGMHHYNRFTFQVELDRPGAVLILRSDNSLVAAVPVDGTGSYTYDEILGQWITYHPFYTLTVAGTGEQYKLEH